VVVGVSVGEIMRKGVITVSRKDPLEKAVKIMGRTQIGSVVVLDGGKVVGILTEGDIIRDVLAAGKDYKKTEVGHVMKHPVRTIEPGKDLEEAIRVMRDLEIERLPVVVGGKLKGIITEKMITRVEPALLSLVKEKGNLECVPPAERDVAISGECEHCGNYSDYLRNVEGLYLCEDCR
jgi:CBS domain-containing protein